MNIALRIGGATMAAVLGLGAAYCAQLGTHPSVTVILTCMTVYTAIGTLFAEAALRWSNSTKTMYLMSYILWIVMLVWMASYKPGPANDS